MSGQCSDSLAHWLRFQVPMWEALLICCTALCCIHSVLRYLYEFLFHIGAFKLLCCRKFTVHIKCALTMWPEQAFWLLSICTCICMHLYASQPKLQPISTHSHRASWWLPGAVCSWPECFVSLLSGLHAPALCGCVPRGEPRERVENKVLNAHCTAGVLLLATLLIHINGGSSLEWGNMSTANNLYWNLCATYFGLILCLVKKKDTRPIVQIHAVQTQCCWRLATKPWLNTQKNIKSIKPTRTLRPRGLTATGTQIQTATGT